jgi:adenylate cyclase
MDRRFEVLLLQYVEEPDKTKRQRIEQKLWEKFGATKAVLVMDVSRFSLLTQRYGIVYNLSMVRRMQLTSKPIIEGAGGEVVKFEADNCFAMFDDVLSATKAAIAINQAFAEENARTQEEFDIRVGIGIDHGDVLLIGGPDYFGAAVNRASKLGEDIAGPGEILMTETAFEQIPKDADIRSEPLELEISGIALNSFSIKY